MTGHGGPAAPDRAHRREIRNIQALRGIAALMVVGAHLGGTTGFESKVFGPHQFWESFEYIGQTGVDLFFVVSGFIMIVTTARVAHGALGARRFLWRRVTRVYPPYLVITAAIFAIYTVRPDLINSSQETPPDVAASFLLLPQAGLPLLLVGWTLVYEMYFYLVFTIGLLLPKRLFPYLLGAWALATVLLGLLPQTNPYIKLASSPLNFEFLFGVIIGHLFVSGRLVAPRTFAALGAAGAIASYALLAISGEPYESVWIRVFTTGVLLAVTAYGLVGLEHTGQLVMPGGMVRLGDWSYSIYLTHVLALKVLSLVLIGIGASGPLLRVLSVPIAFGIAIVGGALYFALVERPLVRVLHDRSRAARGPGHVATAGTAEAAASAVV